MIATGRSRVMCRPRYTVAIPPSPIFSRTSYRSRVSPITFGSLSRDPSREEARVQGSQWEGVGCPGTKPADGLCLERAGCPVDQRTAVECQVDEYPVFATFREAVYFGADLDFDAQLFLQFTSEGLLGGFVRLDLPAREFPEPWVVPIVGTTLCQKDCVVAFDQSSDDLQCGRADRVHAREPGQPRIVVSRPLPSARSSKIFKITVAVSSMARLVTSMTGQVGFRRKISFA